MDNIKHERSKPHPELQNYCNSQLMDSFGTDTLSGLPIWRVSYADEQFEKRFGTFEDYTRENIFIRRVTETREVPKYPHLKGRYVLERLVVIPDMNLQDLPTQKISYEPIHPFWDSNGDYLPPNWTVCKFIVDVVYAAEGKQSLRKYVDPDADGNNGLEAQKERVKEIVQGLYGNETAVTDHLAYKTGVFVDSTKTKVN